MENKETKYLEDLSSRIIKNSTIESPSFDFTDSVMSRVNALCEKATTVYHPLISKTTWVLIGLSILALVLYILFFGNKLESSNLIQSIDFSLFSNINMDVLPSFSISKTVTYAILFFGLMVCIQIPLLKNHFDKRFEE